MFDAAKDFVFTNSADGKTITSGGYRISKILGGRKKKQRGGRKKKEGDEEEIENFYNEESGIPMGLLHFGPKFFVEQEHLRAHAESPRRKEDVEHNEHNNEHNNVIELELVMPMPSSPSQYNVKNFNNCGLEDAKDVVDDDLFCKFLESASLADSGANNFHSERKMTRKRTLNNINLKNLKVDKVVYARRKTRKH
jgi:hypothetical protein